MNDKKRFLDNFDLVNLLYAGFHSRHAGLGLLNTYATKGTLGKELAVSQRIVEQMDAWGKQLWAGHLLIDTDNPADFSEEAQNALQLLEGLIDSQQRFAATVQTLLEKRWQDLNTTELATLTAAYVQRVFRDHFMHQGLMQFAKRNNDEALLAKRAKASQRVAESMKTVQLFVDRLNRIREWPAVVKLQAVLLAEPTPPIFRLRNADLRFLRARLTHTEDDPKSLGLENDWEWRNTGYELFTAATWQALGLGMIDALAWQDAGLDRPGLVAEWLCAGYQPSETREWLSAGLKPEQAAFWKRLGVRDPQAALAMEEEAGGASRALAWLGAGEDLSRIADWSKIGIIDVDQVRDWKESGFVDPDEAGQWISRRITHPAAAGAWKEAGISPEKAGLWTFLKLPPDQAKTWVDADLDNPAEVREWLRHSVADPDAVLWLKARAQTVFAVDPDLLEQAPESAAPLCIAPLPARHAGILFWGVVYDGPEIPWNNGPNPENGPYRVEQWAGRFLERSGGESLTELGCVFGRYGSPPDYARYYAAIAESERVAHRGRALPLEPVTPLLEWTDRLKHFLEIMGLPIAAPCYWLAGFVKD